MGSCGDHRTSELCTRLQFVEEHCHSQTSASVSVLESKNIIDPTTSHFPQIFISGPWSNEGLQGCAKYFTILHNTYATAELEYITCKPFACLEGYNEQCTEV